MGRFESDGLSLAFEDEGDGYPLFLLHGFAADSKSNWRLSGWTRALRRAGYRVIAADARGHGDSDKPSNPDAYAPQNMSGDVLRLMDHLDIPEAVLFGYSMGGRNAAWLLANHQHRFSAVVIGGVGESLLRGNGNAEVESLTGASMVPIYETVTRTGDAARALSACLLGSFPCLEASVFANVRTPSLIVAGSRDTVAGSPYPLADVIPKARAVVVPGRSHLSVLTDNYFKGAVIGFLGDRW
jgi:pimeloyl-ACP methyl ester carboxylesterase